MEVFDSARELNNTVSTCTERLEVLSSMCRTIERSLGIAVARATDAAENLDENTVTYLRDSVKMVDESLRDFIIELDGLIYKQVSAIISEASEVSTEARRDMLLKQLINNAVK